MASNTNRVESPADDLAECEDVAPGHQEKLRQCLVCSEEFVSTWAGERVCKRCRSSSRWRQG